MKSKILTTALIIMALIGGFCIGKYEPSLSSGGVANIADPFN